jgi:ubiquinone/menaquinone biosynthesis C-methylase UbiE
MVGPEGQVFAVDLQEKMIKSLKRRASRAGISDRIDARVCHENSLDIGDLAGNIDLALAIHVVHEVPDVPRLMTEIFDSLRPGARLFVIEPKGHSSNEEFTAMISHAVKVGFTVVENPKIKRDRAVVFEKNSDL